MYEVTAINWVTGAVWFKDCPDYAGNIFLCEFLLFTGLKDKNGKESFESDLVSFPDGVYKIQWNTIRTGFFMRRNDRKGTTHFRDMEEISEGEVIGNIFENPDLLTGRKCKEG